MPVRTGSLRSSPSIIQIMKSELWRSLRNNKNVCQTDLFYHGEQNCNTLCSVACVVAICRGLSNGELHQVPDSSKCLSDFVSKSTLLVLLCNPNFYLRRSRADHLHQQNSNRNWLTTCISKTARQAGRQPSRRACRASQQQVH